MTADPAPVASIESTKSRSELINPYADDPKTSEAAGAVRPVTVAARGSEPLPRQCKEYQVAIDKLANGCHDERVKATVNQLRDEWHRQYANWDDKDAEQKAQLTKMCPMFLAQLHSEQMTKFQMLCEAE